MEEKLASIFLGIEKDRRSVIIDVTNTYFIGDSIDPRTRKGKEGRIKKPIQIALVVTGKRVFPLFHRNIPGQCFQQIHHGRYCKGSMVQGLYCNYHRLGSVTSKENKIHD